MKTLNKSRLIEKAGHVQTLTELSEAVESAIDEYNAAVEDLKPAVQEAVDKYNEALANARAFCDEVASDAQGYAEDKSDRWTESDAGQSYWDFVNQWLGIGTGELDDIEIEFPQEVDCPGLEAAINIDDLPDTPE